MHIVFANPLRPGHEMIYHPGKTNFRRATPIDITRVLKVNKPMVRATYALAEVKEGQLAEQVTKALNVGCGCGCK